MWFLDKLRSLATTSKDKILAKTISLGNYMETTSAKLVDKLPGWDSIKKKAEEYTKKTVSWIGEESKEMIKEWKEFVHDHMHKTEPAKKDTKDTTTSKDVAAKTDKNTSKSATTSPVSTPKS